jgi:ubiquinone/menaquinone biosynthesis C-methylase UbiE
VSTRRQPVTAYDRIAHLYDVDMARNMRFDDVALYSQICSDEGGRALELGCGNGRVLIELNSRGIDAVGVDRSPRMLEELRAKALARGASVGVGLMDARTLAFERGLFQVVLCPYSLVTYMTGANDVDLLLDGIARVLRPGGVAVLDAFIPRPLTQRPRFVADYSRSFRGTTLRRSKRISTIAPGINRIERRYEIVSADGATIERLRTREDIREFTADELVVRLATHGLQVEQTWWDYGATHRPADAQFFTLLGRLRPPR